MQINTLKAASINKTCLPPHLLLPLSLFLSLSAHQTSLPRQPRNKSLSRKIATNKSFWAAVSATATATKDISGPFSFASNDIGPENQLIWISKHRPSTHWPQTPSTLPPLAGRTAARHHVRCQSKRVRVRVQNGAQRGSWLVVLMLLTNPNYSLPHLPQNELVHVVVVDSVRCLGACTWQRDYKLIRTKFTIELNLFARPAGAVGGGCGPVRIY